MSSTAVRFALQHHFNLHAIVSHRRPVATDSVGKPEPLPRKQAKTALGSACDQHQAVFEVPTAGKGGGMLSQLQLT